MPAFTRTITGQGPPVVFVHGALGDHRSWNPQARAIGQRYRFISYSRRYHFPDRWTPGGPPYSFRQHADDLSEVIRSTGADPVHLVGHSYGGSVALLLAQSESGLVRSLSLSEPAASSILPGNARNDELRRSSREGFAPARSAIAAGDEVRALRVFMGIVNEDPDAFDRYPRATQALLLDNASTLGPMLASNDPLPVTDADLRGLRLPVLLVQSSTPTPVMSAVMEHLAESIPGAERVTIPGTGHGLTYQNPAAYNAALLRFLERH